MVPDIDGCALLSRAVAGHRQQYIEDTEMHQRCMNHPELAVAGIVKLLGKRGYEDMVVRAS